MFTSGGKKAVELRYQDSAWSQADKDKSLNFNPEQLQILSAITADLSSANSDLCLRPE